MSQGPRRRHPGVFRLRDAPQAIVRLPEPLRSKALDAVNQLLDERPDLETETIIRLAVEQAHEFKATRVPFGEEAESGDE